MSFILLAILLVTATVTVATAVAGWARVLEYGTLAVLVVGVLTVAFCLDTAPSIRTRLWAVGERWADAVQDSTVTSVVGDRTVSVASTRAAAVRLLIDTIGEL